MDQPIHPHSCSMQSMSRKQKITGTLTYYLAPLDLNDDNQTRLPVGISKPRLLGLRENEISLGLPDRLIEINKEEFDDRRRIVGE